MAHVVGTLSGCEQAQGGGQERTDLIEAAWPRGAERRFQFGEGKFDRIEVRTVGREKAKLGPDGFDRGADLRLFVQHPVVEHHHVTGAQRRDQDLFDIGEEARVVEGTVEDRWRAEALKPQRGDDGVRLPVATRGVVVQPYAAETPALAAEQIGRHPAFIEEHVLADVSQRLPRPPLPPRRRDVRPALLVGVHGFF